MTRKRPSDLTGTITEHPAPTACPGSGSLPPAAASRALSRVSRLLSCRAKLQLPTGSLSLPQLMGVILLTRRDAVAAAWVRRCRVSLHSTSKGTISCGGHAFKQP